MPKHRNNTIRLHTTHIEHSPGRCNEASGCPKASTDEIQPPDKRRRAELLCHSDLATLHRVQSQLSIHVRPDHRCEIPSYPQSLRRSSLRSPSEGVIMSVVPRIISVCVFSRTACIAYISWCVTPPNTKTMKREFGRTVRRDDPLD
jgi:hypothetical protein